MRVWIDIDNPPQVQYLMPVARAFESEGHDVLLTARDNGATLALLQPEDVDFHAIGSAFGKGKGSKLKGVVERSITLVRLFRRVGRPRVVVSSSRSSTLAARLMRIPSYIVCDYEFVDLRSYRLLGATMVFPDVIDKAVFRSQGFPERRLLPFRGLKEDMTFSGVPLDTIEPHSFPEIPSSETVRILFRPPAEESHYYSERSGSTTTALLKYLARREEAVVVFAPRYARQSGALTALDWHNPPVVLARPLPFIPLLTACDLVISSGGTMLREAAYLGIPAYSAFGGQRGHVDTYLASIGRLRFVEDDYSVIPLVKRVPGTPLTTNADLPKQLAQAILDRVS